MRVLADPIHIRSFLEELSSIEEGILDNFDEELRKQNQAYLINWYGLKELRKNIFEVKLLCNIRIIYLLIDSNTILLIHFYKWTRNNGKDNRHEALLKLQSIKV